MDFFDLGQQDFLQFLDVGWQLGNNPQVAVRELCAVPWPDDFACLVLLFDRF